MSQQRWRRFLPERSQFLLLGVVLAVIFALVGFINLAIIKSSTLVENQGARVRLERAQDQSQRLQGALGEAQQGQNIPIKGWEYYRLTPPEVTVVMPAPEAAPEAASEAAPLAAGETAALGHRHAAGPPYWADWLKRLVKP
ncbi:MAG: hypothetical protein CVU38_07385 [Chloroflexi bacterium HGW-Chloroflexi-1]|nr:MAG: hypothetical protein CVU38_07385 [Chloroflexi bacterium HGW-Chloroflexi-1]